MLTPIRGSCSAPMKVAIPSGKLWMLIASAENTPMRISRFASWAWLARGCARFFISCGFSYDGTSRSINAIRPMPAKNAPRAIQLPVFTS